MSAAELTYTLRRLGSTGQDSELLAQALTIYHADTPQFEATATNDFLYWISRYNKKFDDQLFIFCLQLNGKVVGFCECVYFAGENFVVIDYMTVSAASKTVGVFLQFYELIVAFLDDEAIYYDFIVAEILQNSEKEYTESSEFWRAVMAFERFRIIEAEFFQPQLGRTKYGTALPSRILIRADNELTSFDRQTYLMIVETLILRHYVRWYEPFFRDGELSAYQHQAEELVRSIRSSLGEKPRLNLSEMSSVVLPSGSVQARYRSSARYIVYETVSYAILLAALVAAKVGLALKVTEVLLLAVGALVIRMALLSIFVPEARETLNSSLGALALLLGKKQPVAGKAAAQSRKHGAPVDSG